MKKRLLAFFTLLCCLLGILATATACEKEEAEMIDYAAQAVLDLNSTETIKQKVTVENYIDGDTTHFKVPTSIVATGVLKARYLAVNTPESTGKIEEWGKKASAYTRSHLDQKDVSIIIETDGDKWAVDSTGERYLVWVWYKTPDMETYRNLNLELLQEGLAVGSKASETRYGSIAVAAINQAVQFKLHVHSQEQDPDYYYGIAKEITLKELRLNPSNYNGIRVAFEGVVTQYNSNGVYVEEYDQETNLYYGIYVYYGFTLGKDGQDLLIQKGNRMRIVGVVGEFNGNYQVSDLNYDPFEEDDPENLQQISQGNVVAYPETTVSTFTGKLSVTVINDEGEEVSEIRDYAAVRLNSTISMKNLYVEKAYTTSNGGANDGAITLTCKVDGKTVVVRTTKLYEDDNKTLVKQDVYVGKTIDVRGIIDMYEGEYQIKVFDKGDITIH